jgi:hypothetical protein
MKFLSVIILLLSFIFTSCSSRQEEKERKLSYLNMMSLYEKLRMDYLINVQNDQVADKKYYLLQQVKLIKIIREMEPDENWSYGDTLKIKMVKYIKLDTSYTSEIMKNKSENIVAPMDTESKASLETIKSTINNTDSDIKKIIDEEHKKVINGFYSD